VSHGDHRRSKHSCRSHIAQQNQPCNTVCVTGVGRTGQQPDSMRRREHRVMSHGDHRRSKHPPTKPHRTAKPNPHTTTVCGAGVGQTGQQPAVMRPDELLLCPTVITVGQSMAPRPIARRKQTQLPPPFAERAGVGQTGQQPAVMRPREHALCPTMIIVGQSTPPRSPIARQSSPRTTVCRAGVGQTGQRPDVMRLL